MFIQDNGRGNYFDEIVILLETGLRVSELYGLTMSDVDFTNRCMHIKRQLCRTADKPYFITPPKTRSGVRDVPLSNAAIFALRRVLKNRDPRIEVIIDGHSGFLFLDKNERPKVASHLENYMRNMMRKYKKIYGNTLPNITPHTLRHTFCTKMQQAGIDVKSLQYLMGHSNASVTLDVYSHNSYDSAERAFRAVVC